MKTIHLILLFVGIGLIAAIPISFVFTQQSHYSLEIQGMKNTYVIGEEYSFYYTLSGYGNTCGTWFVWYPDQNGDIIHKGEVVDCHRPTNVDISYDSRKDVRMFRSFVPNIEGIYNVTVSVEKVKEPVIHEFRVVSSDSQVKQVSDLNVQNCNGIDGREELECFANSFESCNPAMINYVIYTIEGDPGYLKAVVEGNNECYIHITFDNTQDRFSHPNDRIITENRCSNIEFTKHTMNIGDCDNFYDYQLNYQSPDWASHEKCQSISGEWNYEFHNCAGFNEPIESSCENMGGTISCMSHEQKGHGRDVCIAVCEFEVVDTK